MRLAQQKMPSPIAYGYSAGQNEAERITLFRHNQNVENIEKKLIESNRMRSVHVNGLVISCLLVRNSKREAIYDVSNCHKLIGCTYAGNSAASWIRIPVRLGPRPTDKSRLYEK